MCLIEQNFEESTPRNKPVALDGSFRDTLTMLQYSKLRDCMDPNSLTILSHTTKVSNGLSEKGVKKDINTEIKFFDAEYFKTRKFTSKCAIDFSYSGHGLPGMLLFSKNEQYFYENMIENFVTSL